ncbi:hypothetical protein AB833_25780 [Chromatiales bacterium (ex Bugula neritina AB1)]|nr:hypothetical protein AB833_25780 [Chromatiales bacterium (ex Bugula neritina AB1)]
MYDNDKRCESREGFALNRFSVSVINGLSLPDSVGKLRYEQYVQEQGKKYPTADHDNQLLFDEADAQSVHIVAFSEDGNLLSALRLTPVAIANNIDYFSAFVSQKASCDKSEDSIVILSRLVRCSSMDGAKSIQHIFRFCFDYCVKREWTYGLIHTSPKLRSLFIRYGWRQIAEEYHDQYAGPQVLLYLDALDKEHLRQIRSPYL